MFGNVTRAADKFSLERREEIFAALQKNPLAEELPSWNCFDSGGLKNNGDCKVANADFLVRLQTARKIRERQQQQQKQESKSAHADRLIGQRALE